VLSWPSEGCEAELYRLTFCCRLSSWKSPWTLLGGLYHRGGSSARRSLTGADSQASVQSQSATASERVVSTIAPTSNLPDFPVLSTSQPISPGRCVDTPGDYEDTYSPSAWLAGAPSSIPSDRRVITTDELERTGAALLSGPYADATRSAWPFTNDQVIFPPVGCSTSQARSIRRRPVPLYGSIGQAISAGVGRPESSSSAILIDSLPRLQRPSVPGGSYENEFRSFAAQSGALLPLEDTSDGESSTPSAFSTIVKSAAMVAAGLAVAGTALYFGGASTAFGRQVQEDQSTMRQLSRVGGWMTSGITSGMGAVSSLTRSWQGDGHAGGGGGYNIASVWS
jgi:hypothetical protein